MKTWAPQSKPAYPESTRHRVERLMDELLATTHITPSETCEEWLSLCDVAFYRGTMPPELKEGFFRTSAKLEQTLKMMLNGATIVRPEQATTDPRMSELKGQLLPLCLDLGVIMELSRPYCLGDTKLPSPPSVGYEKQFAENALSGCYNILALDGYRWGLGRGA